MRLRLILGVIPMSLAACSAQPASTATGGASPQPTEMAAGAPAEGNDLDDPLANLAMDDRPLESTPPTADDRIAKINQDYADRMVVINARLLCGMEPFADPAAMETVRERAIYAATDGKPTHAQMYSGLNIQSVRSRANELVGPSGANCRKMQLDEWRQGY